MKTSILVSEIMRELKNTPVAVCNYKGTTSEYLNTKQLNAIRKVITRRLNEQFGPETDHTKRDIF